MGLILSFIAYICKTAKCILRLTLILNIFTRISFKDNEKECPKPHEDLSGVLHIRQLLLLLPATFPTGFE